MYYEIENPHGGDIYGSQIRLDFSANVNPYGTPQSVIRAAERAVSECGRYPDPYCRELCAAIAEKEGVCPGDVFVGNGASELIHAYCMASKYSRAAIAAPAFAEYAEGLKTAGSEILYYIMKKETGFVPDEGLTAFLRKEKPEALFLCSPNNPTGRTIPADIMAEILQISKEQGVRIFLDECFYELSDLQITLKDEISNNKNLFLLRAFTKCFGLAGLRLGYCLCADHDLLRKMSAFTPAWSVSHPAQRAGIAALKEQGFVNESVRKIRTERQQLQKQLKELGFFVYPSETNYLFFEGPPDLAEKLLKEGVLIRKCSNYAGLTEGYYRIAVRTREQNEELISTLRKIYG